MLAESSDASGTSDAGDRPPSVTRTKERSLWEITRGQRLRYALAIAAMALANVFIFGVPLVSMRAIDGVVGGSVPEGDTLVPLLRSAVGDDNIAGQLWLAAGLVAGLTAIGATFHFVRGRLASSASEAIVCRLRDRLLEHLNELPCTEHDGADTGDLVQRCTSDVETIRVFLSAQVVEIGRSILLVLTVLPILLSLDGRMTAVSLGLFPVILASAVLFFRRVKELFLKTDEAEGEMTTVLQENLTGIRVVRAFARQEFEREKFAAKNAAHRDRNFRLIRLLGLYWGASDLLCFLQIGSVLIAGAWWMQQGMLSVGELFAFLTYVAMVIWPIRHLGRVLTDTGKAVVALGRVGEILEKDAESDLGELKRARAGAPEPSSPPPATITFEDVFFRYHPEGDPVLDGVGFTIPAGTTAAFVGPPGSGKSTIVQLLLRLYDLDEGDIRIGEQSIVEMSRRDVRRQVASVLQEPFLYSKSITANVRVGRRDASQSDIEIGTSASCIHESIEEFDDGYETLVGERGVTLSGGQRQRVALARALVKGAPILILDDALSAVDTDTETAILAALEARDPKATTIVISHRLSSVVHADQIFVLERGKVVERGTHGELSAAGGVYQRLWQIQGELEDQIETDLSSGGGEGDTPSSASDRSREGARP